MSRLSASLIVFALAICRPAVAQFAPAGVPVHFENQATAFQRDGDHECLIAVSNADGAQVQFADCASADPASIAWTVTQGSAIGSGAAPSGPIKIFGNKCLDVTDGVNADGTKLQIWTCSGGPNQNFNVNADETITWTNSNKCVDIGVTGDVRVQISTCSSNDSGRNWLIHPAASPSQIIWSKAGNLCLAASSNTNGAPVFIDACTGTPHASTENRTWVLPSPGVQGQISTFNGAKCLDVTNGVVNFGVKLQVWSCTGGPNQQFTLDVDGVQAIGWTGAGSANVVDVTNGDGTPGNQIQLWSFGNGAAGGVNPNQIFFV